MKVIRLLCEDIASQSCENLQTFVRGWVGKERARLCPAPPLGKRLENFPTLRSYIFVGFQETTLKLSNFTNFKTFFPVVSLACPCQKLKKQKQKQNKTNGMVYTERGTLLGCTSQYKSLSHY